MKSLPYIMLVCLVLFMTMGLWLISEDPSTHEITESQDTSYCEWSSM